MLILSQKKWQIKHLTRKQKYTIYQKKSQGYKQSQKVRLEGTGFCYKNQLCYLQK